jgi:hypothetical protein
MEFQIKTISDGKVDQEEKIRRMPWYDFNFHILWLKKRQEDMDEK